MGCYRQEIRSTEDTLQFIDFITPTQSACFRLARSLAPHPNCGRPAAIGIALRLDRPVYVTLPQSALLRERFGNILELLLERAQ